MTISGHRSGRVVGIVAKHARECDGRALQINSFNVGILGVGNEIELGGAQIGKVRYRIVVEAHIVRIPRHGRR